MVEDEEQFWIMTSLKASRTMEQIGPYATPSDSCCRVIATMCHVTLPQFSQDDMEKRAGGKHDRSS